MDTESIVGNDGLGYLLFPSNRSGENVRGRARTYLLYMFKFIYTQNAVYVVHAVELVDAAKVVDESNVLEEVEVLGILIVGT